MDEREFSELRAELMIASQDYLSVVAEVDNALRELDRPVSNSQLTLWHALREKERRYKMVYDTAIENLSRALGQSLGVTTQLFVDAVDTPSVRAGSAQMIPSC